ncbi:hypothetical protein [Coleofasciculus sp. FACHB-SPT36]|uniref:hypothetical protein n=1 Tax=Cyanophyceae TaxID=3028117 RepID=UPI00168B81B9|nr:hypothetical protein [Coleofasciculus sp. FACHB-SPT36]MBD2537515.1 hypothetical protein [Coleofasciculus sp. FACHB-SPT36]
MAENKETKENNRFRLSDPDLALIKELADVMKLEPKDVLAYLIRQYCPRAIADVLRGLNSSDNTPSDPSQYPLRPEQLPSATQTQSSS